MPGPADGIAAGRRPYLREPSGPVLASASHLGRTGRTPDMKRSIALALISLAAAAGLVDVDASAPSATSEFRSYGGGWGHGVGMSQYGAYGMAAAGASYTDILAQYYTGTAVQTVASPTKIRVGLTQSRTSSRLQAIGGAVALRLDSHSG